MPQDYLELMSACWQHDPSIRPTFLEVMTRLSTIAGDHTSIGGTSMTSTSSLSVSAPGQSHGSMSSSGSMDTGSRGSGVAAPGATVQAPVGEIAIVFTDITRAASLWEHDPEAMRDATLLHNETIRSYVAPPSS